MTRGILRSWRSAIGLSAAIACLSGCAVGPDFKGAPPVASGHYDETAERHLSGDDHTGPDQQIRFVPALEGDWWSMLGSAKLDATMRKAIAGNLDLVAADATIAQADEAVSATRGGLRPQVDFGAQGGRQHEGGLSSNFYSVGPTASFDFDLFGGTRRLVEERAAVADVQRHHYDAAYLTLTGDVATEALMLASARAQIAAVQALIEDDRRNLALFETGHRFGSATQVDIALARTQLAQDETLLPPLAQQCEVARHALSVLASKGPADWVPPDFDLADFTLPPDLPVTLPSEIARRRPDILAAEAQLHAASAAMGVATADLYPHIQISGSLGTAGPGIGTLWNIAGGLAAPIFHGGTLKANRRGAEDGYRATLASYRQTVVRSLRQVADILQSIDHDAEEHAAQERALTSAGASLTLNRAGYKAGEIDVLQVLDAERAYQRALIGAIQARTARYLDVIQLAVALGGNASGAFDRRTAASDTNYPSDIPVPTKE